MHSAACSACKPLMYTPAKFRCVMSQSHACMQSLEEVQGVLGQEMQGLKAERTKFKDLLHDAKWTAAQAPGPDPASVISPLFSHCPCVECGHFHRAYSGWMHLKCENSHHMLGAQLAKTSYCHSCQLSCCLYLDTMNPKATLPIPSALSHLL